VRATHRDCGKFCSSSLLARMREQAASIFPSARKRPRFGQRRIGDQPRIAIGHVLVDRALHLLDGIPSMT
jgi:hypothetical protein